VLFVDSMRKPSAHAALRVLPKLRVAGSSPVPRSKKAPETRGFSFELERLGKGEVLGLPRGHLRDHDRAALDRPPEERFG
jgi:hypothetical protein